MGINQSKPRPKYRSGKHKNILKHNVFKASLSLFKPALTALAFLLVSTLGQHLVSKVDLPGNCFSNVSTVVGSSLMSAAELENKEVTVGARTLIITRHTAQRMVERGVTIAQLKQVIKVGKLFAYEHGGLIKIGYWYKPFKIFLAVDKRHEKIITTIKNISHKYVVKLIELNSVRAGRE